MSAKVERSRSSSATSPVSAMHSHHDHARNVHHKEALRLALGSILAPKRPYTPVSRSTSGSATPAHPATFSTESLLNRPSDLSHLHSRPSSHSHPHAHSHLQHPHHLSPSSRLGRPDLTTPPGIAPQFSQPHYFFTHPHSAASSPAPSNSNSGAATPEHSSVPGSASGSPPTANSPAAAAMCSPNPVSVPEEDQLQLLPPIVAAGSRSRSVEGLVTAVPHMGPSENSEADHGNQSLRDNVLHDDKFHHPHENGGALTPRARFIETLQSKNKAWDALIHGSFS